MSVRAKFYVSSVTKQGSPGCQNPTAEVTLEPVKNDGEENKSWSKYTPNGKIELTITNPAAAEQFEVGKSYFVDFTPAG